MESVQLTHAEYRRCLEQAIDADRHYPWLRQSEHLIDIATMSDEGVSLRVERPSTQ